MLVSKNTKEGFTLIELLIVVGVIGLLAAVIFSNLNQARERARITAGISLAGNLYRGFGADSLGIWEINEGSGSSIANKGGNGSPGVINGATWVSDGPNNTSALHFNSGNRVDLGPISIGSNVTVAAWVRTTSNAGQQVFFSNRGNGLYLGTATGKVFAFFNTASPSTFLSIKKINDGKWHHVVWVSDSTKASIYIDGNLDSSISQTRGASSLNNAYIGYDSSTGDYFSGDISQLGIYNQALAASVIQNIYALSKDSDILATK